MEKTESQMLTIVNLCLGVLFICLRGEVVYIALILLAVVLLSIGLMDILEQKTTTGLIELGIGLITALFAWVPVFSSVSFYLLGILLILLGVYEIVKTCQHKTQGKSKVDIFSLLVIPVLCVISGILLFFSQPWVFIVIGVLLLLAGILNFCQIYVKPKKTKNVIEVEGTEKE